MPNKNKILALAVMAAFVISPFFATVVAQPQNWGNHTLAAGLEPAIQVKGNVTKDIIDLNNIWLYTDDDGQNQTLQYTRADNITFDIGNIYFAKPFENASVKGVIATSESGVDLQAQYLVDANIIPYLLLTVQNTSNVVNSYIYGSLEDTVDRTFSPDAYIIFGIKCLYTDTGSYTISVKLRLIDEGGEDHILSISVTNASGTDTIQLLDINWNGAKDTKTDDIQLTIYNKNPIDKYIIIQFKIRDLFDKVGLSTNIVKISGVGYSAKSSGVSAGSNTIKAAFRLLRVVDKKILINGMVVNGTTISINSDIIQPNIQILKIADAIIPFEFSPVFDANYNGDDLSGSYTWIFSLPSDSALVFSNVIGNITLPAQYSSIEYALLNGADIKSSLDSNKYYTFAVTSGSQYVIQIKLIYPENVFDQIVQTESPPAFWAAPSENISWWFWAIIGFFATLLGGFGAGLRQRSKEGKRKAAAKYKSKVK